MRRILECSASDHPKAASIVHPSSCPAVKNGILPQAKTRWERIDAVVNPQINAAGTHHWPFEVSFPIDVRFFACGGRQDIRMNRHEYFELMYIYEGTVNVDVHEKNLTVRAGDLLVIGSELFHRVSVLGGARVAVLFFLPELIRPTDNVGEAIEYLSPLLLQGTDFPHIVSSETGIPGQVHTLMMHIWAQLPAVSGRARLTAKTYLKMILVFLVNHYAEHTFARKALDRRRRDMERLQPLFHYIEQHYQDKLRLRAAAKLCGMSNSYFMFFFKKLTGQSFVAYLIHFRIAKAQALLINTDMSVSEISQAVGFCDQSHLGLAFRNLAGTTPLAYRLNAGMLSQPTIRTGLSLVPAAAT
jgi:AraC-like DNA-binding protein/mannose-6-phosphate isomerase-like protein (cupin superfamily)